MLFKNCATVIVDLSNGTQTLRNVDLLTKGSAIKAIGPNLSAAGATLKDASGWFIYPEAQLAHTAAPDPIRIHPKMAETYQLRVRSLISGLSKTGNLDILLARTADH